MGLPFRVAVHIGYHKTATTWFQEVAFNEHPQIVPIPRYPLRDRIEDHWLLGGIVMDRDEDFAPAHLRERLIERVEKLDVDLDDKVVLVSAERLSGHAASGGRDVGRIAERVHATLPEGRIVCLVRDRARSIRSTYVQLVSAGWTGKVAETLATPTGHRRPGFDLAYWEYERALDAYSSRFGVDQLLVADYGRFASEPHTVLRELSSFLGIDEWQLPRELIDKKLRLSSSDRVTRMRRFLNQFRRSELNPYPLFELPPLVRKPLLRLSQRLPAGQPLFDDEFDQWVDRRFATSDQRLEADYGIELTKVRAAAREGVL
jgi:hypothetical protein